MVISETAQYHHARPHKSWGEEGHRKVEDISTALKQTFEGW